MMATVITVIIKIMTINLSCDDNDYIINVTNPKHSKPLMIYTPIEACQFISDAVLTSEIQ